jgi:hypothetical protein
MAASTKTRRALAQIANVRTFDLTVEAVHELMGLVHPACDE